MIRKCTESDFETIFEIINDAAMAYKGIIPDDRWHEPYMPKVEVRQQIEDGVIFWGFQQDRKLLGVMGIQGKGDVVLIRHAYVRPKFRKQGIGEKLLRYLEGTTEKPILIGTWKAASWAISFYEKNGYVRVSEAETDRLLRKYWNIPERQIETSVVLANQTFLRQSENEINSFLDIVRNVYDNLPFNRLLGLTVAFLERDRAGFRFEMKNELIGNTVHGILHGGVISAVLDTTGGMTATASAIEKSPELSTDEIVRRIARIGTIDMRVDYLRPGRGIQFQSTGTVMRTGNKVAVTRMELKNQEDVLIAVGTGTYIVG